jgi:hypothetical protein
MLFSGTGRIAVRGKRKIKTWQTVVVRVLLETNVSNCARLLSEFIFAPANHLSSWLARTPFLRLSKEKNAVPAPLLRVALLGFN